MAAEPGDALTDRELEVTELVAEGLTNREVAERLYLSHNTVKVHLRNIFTKTGVASRTELSMLAVQEGWITIEIEGEEETPSTTQEGKADSQTIAVDAATPDRRLHWPWQQWLLLTAGVVLALVVFLLPQRRTTSGAVTGPGEVFGAGNSAPSLAAAVSEDGWEELTPLPVRRAGMGATAQGGKAYVIGGMTANGPTGRMDIYDVAEGAWTEGTARPVAVVNAGAAILDGAIWSPGGCNATWEPRPDVHRYLPSEDTWSEVSPLPEALCAYAMTSYDDQLYLFGGWNGESYRALTLVYTPADDSWAYRMPPQQARGYGAAAVIADRIFYVGGYDGDREWATCEVYFPASDTWESCQSMLQPRGGMSLVATGGRLYAIGGGWETPLGFNERYTPATDQWLVMETPLVGEWRNLGAVPWDTSIYAIGGWSGNDFLNRTYAIEVMPWRVFIPGTFRTP